MTPRDMPIVRSYWEAQVKLLNPVPWLATVGGMGTHLKEGTIQSLIYAALGALETSFVYPPGRTQCAASVLTVQGNVFSAGSYFSASHTLTVHAEQAALVHAAAHGEPLIDAIAIVCAGTSKRVDGFTRPCGLCRQIIHENSLQNGGADIQVIMCNPDGSYTIQTIAELMPKAWPEKA